MASGEKRIRTTVTSETVSWKPYVAIAQQNGLVRLFSRMQRWHVCQESPSSGAIHRGRYDCQMLRFNRVSTCVEAESHWLRLYRIWTRLHRIHLGNVTYVSDIYEYSSWVNIEVNSYSVQCDQHCICIQRILLSVLWGLHSYSRGLIKMVVRDTRTKGGRINQHTALCPLMLFTGGG